MQVITTGNQTPTLWETHSKTYREKPAEFISAGAATVKAWAKSHAESAAATEAQVPFGLLAAVPLADFFGGLNRTPLWAGKSELDYLRQLFSLPAETAIPDDAVTNGILVLGIVYRQVRQADGSFLTEAGPLAERDYLALSQRSLNLLKKATRVYRPDGSVDTDNADVKAAIDLASRRPAKFEKALKEIADKVSPPKKGRKQQSQEAGSEPAADHTVVATVKGAIAYLAAKASMGGLPEISKEIAGDAGLAVMFLKAVAGAFPDSAIGSAPGVIEASLALCDALDQNAVESHVGSAMPPKVRKAADLASMKRAKRAKVDAPATLELVPA